MIVLIRYSFYSLCLFVVFIPAHLVEKVVKTSELVQLRDRFGKQRLSEGIYTPGQIDTRWIDHTDQADELQRAEIQRRNMMADIAHELRTPLAVIQSNLNALLDGVYPLEMNEIATLYDETRLLARLVDDLRELTLAEARQLPLNLQPVDGGNLLRIMATKFTVAADALLTFTVKVSFGKSGSLIDPRKVGLTKPVVPSATVALMLVGKIVGG